MRTNLAAAVLLACGAPALAQQRPVVPDTVVGIDALVVTAERARTALASSVSAVSRLTAAQLARVPSVTLADALRQVPGFAVISFDGLGYEPQLMTRGFYGGGDAEYVVVMVDGKPVNNLWGGGIAWDALPLGAAEAIEIVRGGASALYGDAALGGVVNIITRGARSIPARFTLSGGSFDTWRGSADVADEIAGRAVRAWAGGDRTRGYRAHAERTALRAGADVALTAGERGAVTLSALGHWRDADDPGPLPDPAARDRTAANPFYRFDRSRDRSARMTLDYSRTGPDAQLTASIGGEHRAVDATRTLPLTPQFADTKERALRSTRAAATAQLALHDTPLPGADRLVAGVDAGYGALDSRYSDVVTGPADVYAIASGERGAAHADGTGDRANVAAFASYSLQPARALRIVLGARADWLRDAFAATTPDASTTVATHAAFSPKAGINVQYRAGASRAGHVYASAGKSFKAPTLDQLFDQRRIPVPFPPFAITTSNPRLEPQHGTSIEAGIYQRLSPSRSAMAATLSVSAYQLEMEHELDFDLATFRYVNIGRSRHRGVEAGVRVDGARGAAFVSYTAQRVISQAGQYSGKYLKAIPRNAVSAGVTLAPLGRLETGIFAVHHRDMFLDDANTRELPDYTRVDARFSVRVRHADVFLDVRNALDATYSSSGFPDPGGSATLYLYPAARRHFELGVRTGR